LPPFITLRIAVVNSSLALFLGDVARAARLEHLRGMHLLGKHAQHEYGAAGVLAFDLLDQIEPASAGHRIIENRDIPLELAGELERVVPVLGLPDHGHVVLRGQDLFQTTPDHRVIIRDQDSHGEVP